MVFSNWYLDPWFHAYVYGGYEGESKDKGDERDTKEKERRKRMYMLNDCYWLRCKYSLITSLSHISISLAFNL